MIATPCRFASLVQVILELDHQFGSLDAIATGQEATDRVLGSRHGARVDARDSCDALRSQADHATARDDSNARHAADRSPLSLGKQ